jgi:hypothetical protein
MEACKHSLGLERTREMADIKGLVSTLTPCFPVPGELAPCSPQLRTQVLRKVGKLGRYLNHACTTYLDVQSP